MDVRDGYEFVSWDSLMLVVLFCLEVVDKFGEGF